MRFMPILLLGLLLSFYANADTAFKKADMTEFDEAGHETGSPFGRRGLVMNRQGSKVTSFKFTETFGPPPCTGEICPMMMMPSIMLESQFTVVAKRPDSCGSTRYIAVESSKQPSLKRRLQLVDHSTRRCDDFRKYEWEMSLHGKNGKRLLSGNPTKVEDTASCREKLGNTMCIALFRPAICTAKTIEGGRTTIVPITAEGSNSCHAIAQLKFAACDQGYQPEQFQNEDIVCADQ